MLLDLEHGTQPTVYQLHFQPDPVFHTTVKSNYANGKRAWTKEEVSFIMKEQLLISDILAISKCPAHFDGGAEPCYVALHE